MTKGEKMFKKLDEVENNYEHLQMKLQDPQITADPKQYTNLMKEIAEIEEIVLSYKEYKSCKDGMKSSLEMLDTEKDEEMRAMAKEELNELTSKSKALEESLKILLLPKDPNDNKNIILELRAGAGGDEASLFAEELFRAYSFFASSQKWKLQLISTSPGNAGGFKEIIASVSGSKVFSKMKFESGVHRVQRVPKTESQGRVHTSTITVAVIPEVDDVKIKINQNELRIDTYRSSGNGGQSVNTTDSAVRITHIPSGLVVTCQDGKSQMSNKEQAMKVLHARLHAIAEEKKMKEASDDRLSQIGTGDRSERIRTYNFPQSRITDHRIGFTTHAINDIMGGKVEVLIEPLVTHFQAEALKKQI